MKLKKIFAGMAASAIAMTTFAMGATTVSADSATVYNAGIAFQTNTTWNYRNAYNADDQSAAFPAATVGVQGGAYGVDSNVTCGDTTIQYDGTYTVSIATSGTLTGSSSSVEGTKKDGFILDSDKGLTRNGCPWSMINNSEAVDTGDEEVTQDQLQWEAGGTTDKFNMLLITTDIPCEYNDDDQPVVNGNVVSVSDVTVDMAGTSYAAAGTVYFKSDEDYLTIALINAYADSTIDAAAVPTADGTLSATFTISGLAEAPASDDDTSSDDTSSDDTSSDDTSSEDSDADGDSDADSDTDADGDEDSTGDSSSDDADSTNGGSSDGSSADGTGAASGSTGSTGTGSASGSTGSTGTGSASGSTGSTGSSASGSTGSSAGSVASDGTVSDNTESAESGAPAGIALAIAAMAGAAMVVSKRK